MKNERWADLHVHSNYSDGLLSPAEVIEQAKKRKLSAVGIVDHDTIDGIPEAIEKAKQSGICVVPGIELSTHHNDKDIHIIGYFPDVDNEKMNGYLTLFREERLVRARKMVDNLQDTGVNITLDEVLHKSHGMTIGRPHMAEVLMEKGYVETFQEAFYRYIGYNSQAYEKKYTISPEEAIQLIVEARGLSVLAHPKSFITDDVIASLIKTGLDGIEVIHPNVSNSRSRFLQRIARENGLFITGGSDCHGGRNGSLIIGKYKVPFQIIDKMKEILKTRWNKQIDFCS